MVLENFLVDADILWDRAGKELYEKPEARAGRKMRVRVTNRGVIEDLTGFTLNLGWTSTKDETKFGLDAFDVVDATKGLYELDYSSGMLTNIGTLKAALQLVPTVGNTVESNNFVITVSRSAVDAEAIQSETSFTALTSALVEVNGWNARIDNVEQQYIDKANNLDATYPTRLVSVEQQLEQAVTVSNTAALKADAMASGSPKGVYATLALLQAAYPTGTTGAYVVSETGNWHYWSGSAWDIGGLYQATLAADNSITPKKLNVSYAHIHPSYEFISVDTASKTVTVSDPMMISSENENLTIPAQTVSYATNVQPTWMQHVYYNATTQQIEVRNSGNVSAAKYYKLFSFYLNKVVGGNKNVTINGRRADLINANQLVNVMGKDAIEINLLDKKLYVRGTAYILKEKGFITITTAHPTVDFLPTYSLTNATYKFYVDIYAGNTIKMEALSTDTKDCPIIAIIYARNITTLGVQSIYAIDTTGLVISKLGTQTGIVFPSGSTSNFDWASNRFLLPKELHLLTDVEYSVTAQRFNYNRFSDDDDLLFEMISPTQAITFENTANISSPFEVALNTRIGGIFNGNKADALYKNVKLNFRKPESMVNKQPRVLMIGDSITYGLLPSYTKWWMEKFGATPTMIGTTSNSYALYGLGIEPALSGSPGEGRGGWRLTDYTGTTKREDGSTYLMASNPFWNPTTQAFDFAYYMTNNGYDVSGVDFIVIQLGTNDISGWHNLLAEETIDMPTIAEVVAYMPVEYQKMIDSIHLYDPTIKIGFNPPPLAGIENTFNDKVSQFTEILLHNFDGTQANVYCLANYLSNAPLTGKTHYDAETSLVAVSAINDTKRGAVSTDVHDAETNIMVTSLYTASWIINQG